MARTPDGGQGVDSVEQGSATASTRAPIRVLLADDSYLIREGLKQLLSMSDAIAVVGSCTDEPSTIAAVAEVKPDVLLTDVRMPPTRTDEGVRISEKLRTSHPGVGVVLLSQTPSARIAAELVRHGAEGRGYLLKERVSDLAELVETLQAVAAGECRIDPTLVAGLVQSFDQEAHALDHLTPRQRELLADIAQGKSNQAIARDRFLTLRAVEKHVSEIFARLGISGDSDVSRRVRAALIYLDSTRA